jgi:hypothetical protein
MRRVFPVELGVLKRVGSSRDESTFLGEIVVDELGPCVGFGTDERLISTLLARSTIQ